MNVLCDKYSFDKYSQLKAAALQVGASLQPSPFTGT